MKPTLRLLFLDSNTPKMLQPEERGRAAVLVPGEKWTLVCNSGSLTNELLTYPNSDFVSTPCVESFENYPSVTLDVPDMLLYMVITLLEEMGYNVITSALVPNSWK